MTEMTVAAAREEDTTEAEVTMEAEDTTEAEDTMEDRPSSLKVSNKDNPSPSLLAKSYGHLTPFLSYVRDVLDSVWTRL